jgi:hypothetical protein
MHSGVSAGGRERQGALASGDSLVIRACVAELSGQIARSVSQPPMIVDGYGEDLGLASIGEDTPRVIRGQKRRAQSEPEVRCSINAHSRSLSAAAYGFQGCIARGSAIVCPPEAPWIR